ncbi:MAG: AmmeMemoRadiSam system protein B [Candidatus Omnitrophota bacterium]
MERKVIFALLALLLVLNPSINAQDEKKCEFCGSFYPSDPKELTNFIDKALEEADIESKGANVVGILVPHAGYNYSGKIAAHAYKMLAEKQFDTVVIIASGHRHYPQQITIYPEGYFETPLGKLQVDSGLAQQLESLEHVLLDKSYFTKEHSIEVELPFIQKTLKDVKILPILLGKVDFEQLSGLAQKLNEISRRKRILVLASSDLSHFHAYDDAVSLDNETIGLIKEKNTDHLWISNEYNEQRACGTYPIITLLLYSKLKNAEIKILKSANSGDVTGDKDKVVGYVSAIAYTPVIEVNDKEKTRVVVPKGEVMQNFTLNKTEKKELLNIARSTIESYLRSNKVPEFKVDSKMLDEKRGAFVTLKKNGELRGCIGRIIADMPLYEVVANVAVDSAVNDPRFEPLRYQELKDVEIEISVLTPFEKIKNLDEIDVGKHGLIIKQGFSSGLLLPQVPLEYGWDKETFLKHLCLKAGLPQEAYQDEDAAIYKFSAIVFNEKDIDK